jgi:hypothetical protein
MSSRRGLGFVFAWMTRRSSAAYALLSEAIAFVHEQEIGVPADEVPSVVAHLGAATAYLKLLLLALRPELETLEIGACAVALSELGARHRPHTMSLHGYRAAYFDGLLRSASHETSKLRKFLICMGERKGLVVRTLDRASAHVEEARCRLDGGRIRAGF